MAVVQTIREALGVEIASADDPLDSAEAGGWHLILVDGKALVFLIDDRPFLTVRGLLAKKPEKRFVTVDMGAVKYVCNGADVMAPGIVDADRTIDSGDLVWIRDERNRQPLAVGKALLSGEEMIVGESGKAVKTLHWVGDGLWKLDEQ